MTPDRWIGSHFLGAILLVIFTGCSSRGEAQPVSQAAEPVRHAPDPAPAPAKGERCLGV